MDDETEELATESEIEAIEDTEEPETDPEQSLDDEDEDDEPELDEDGNPIVSEPEPELAEVEYEGKPYKVPPELKDALLRQADYTRKTQEVAEIRKQLEPLVQHATELSQAETSAQESLAAINYELSKFNDVDWEQWYQSDPQAADRAERNFDRLQRAQGKATEQLTMARQQRESIAAQETARRMDEGRKVLAEKIPNFSEKAPKLAEYAMQEYGFSADDLSSIEDPRFFIALNRLVDLENEFKGRKAAKQVKQVEAIKPAAKVKGKSAGAKPGLHDNLSTAEWIRRDQARSARR